jgi:hypothetical protein
MEGTPFVVESNNEDDQEKRRKEERTSKAKKPEVFGMLAVESPAEGEPTPFQKAWEATRKPDAETGKVEEEHETPEPPAEAAMPVERVPEEPARAIVQEMIAPAREEEVEREPEAEISPAPEAAPGPEPAAEEPVEVPEVSPVETPEPEPSVTAEAEPAEISKTVEDKPEPKIEPAEKIELTPEPKTEAEPEPKAEIEPEVERKAEEPEFTEKPETPPDDDGKKPGFIRSLFGRGNRKKAEVGPEPEPAEEAPELASTAVEDEPEASEPEGPRFQFKEKTEEEIAEKHQTETVPEEPEVERKPETKPEHIGQMLLNTEAVPAEESAKPVNEATVSSQEAEKRMHVEAEPTEPATGKRVEALTRTELMQLSEKIEINGNSLRHIYETRLIGERGLRRLAAEYLRGGDLYAALRREVIEHEKDFERDPVMRNLQPTDASPMDGNNAVLEKLLEKADVSLADVNNPTVSYTVPGRKKTRKQKSYPHRNRQLDIALMVTISGLSLLIILVLLVKG